LLYKGRGIERSIRYKFMKGELSGLITEGDGKPNVALLKAHIEGREA
jgi:hypothetical protein